MGAKYDQLDLDERIEMCRLRRSRQRRVVRSAGSSGGAPRRSGRELRRRYVPRGGYKPLPADPDRLFTAPAVVPHRARQPAAVLCCDRLAMGWCLARADRRSARAGRIGHSISHRVDLSLHLPPAPAPGEAAPLPAAGRRRRADSAIRRRRTRSRAARPSMNGLEPCEAREQFGHWEGDPCSSGRSAATCSPSVEEDPLHVHRPAAEQTGRDHR